MTTAPATWAQRGAERLGYQLAVHPRCRHAFTLWLLTHLLAGWSVLAAPPAAASTIAGALNWTGVTDSYGVPVGNYYLSVVSTTEAITKAGPGLSADPSSWTRWLANAVTTGLTHETIIELLQTQAAAYVFLLALALWLLRFAISNTWLAWLATWFRPLFDTLRAILTDLWVFPICLVLGLGVGAYHALWHGRKGFGAGIMLSTFAIGIIGLVLTRDPLSDLSSENGLLTQGRNLGFSVAQAAFANGTITTGGGQAQLQHLSGLIADATVRKPLQLMNFGVVVDDIGSCAHTYTAAMLSPHDPTDSSGPAHALAGCGAPQALAFAQHLSGANLALGCFYGLLGAIFAFFVCYVTYSYVMACCAALVNALLALVLAGPAMIHGRPRRRAGHRLAMFFKHAALLFAYTTYISVVALIVLKMAARGGYADQIGMTHPLARLILIALFSAVAVGVFRWLKHELGDHTRREITDTITDLGRRGRDGYQRGRDAYDRGRDLSSRIPRTKNTTDANGDSSGGPDQPLTGPPANGRPPGGRPPSTNRARRPTPKPQPPAPGGAQAASGPAAAAAPTTGAGSRAGAAATAGEAAAAVAAPEVVVGAAVAAEVTRKLHHADGTRANRKHPRPTGRPTTPAAAAPAPTDDGPPPPTTGRGDARFASQPRVESPSNADRGADSPSSPTGLDQSPSHKPPTHFRQATRRAPPT